MVRLLVALMLLSVLAACRASQPMPSPVPIPGPSTKNTFSWERNSEADMQDYRLWGCWIKGCEMGTEWTMLKVIPQTPPGVRPSYWRELVGSVGAYAVTARDTYGNESAFGAVTTFDRR